MVMCVSTVNPLCPFCDCLYLTLSPSVTNLSLDRELDRLLSHVDVLQNLLERVGGAKQPSASSNYRRSSPQDSSFETLHFKLSECSAAVQKLETTVREDQYGVSPNPLLSMFEKDA